MEAGPSSERAVVPSWVEAVVPSLEAVVPSWVEAVVPSLEAVVPSLEGGEVVCPPRVSSLGSAAPL